MSKVDKIVSSLEGQLATAQRELAECDARIAANPAQKRCGSCRHWDSGTVRISPERKARHCGIIASAEDESSFSCGATNLAYVDFDGGFDAPFLTMAEFGCVLWAGRETA